MLQTLVAYQDRMLELTRRVEGNLSTGGPQAICDLERDRSAMAMLMASYQLFVHREVFEPMLASGVAADVAQARSMKIECIALAADFIAYAKHWSAQDIQSQWSLYVPQARCMVRRIRDHARGVRRVAPPLLGGRSPSSRSAYAI